MDSYADPYAHQQRTQLQQSPPQPPQSQAPPPQSQPPSAHAWPPHLLPHASQSASHNGPSGFPSPVSPHSDALYPAPHAHPHAQTHAHAHSHSQSHPHFFDPAHPREGGLTLNLAGLSVASSPVTPISPGTEADPRSASSTAYERPYDRYPDPGTSRSAAQQFTAHGQAHPLLSTHGQSVGAFQYTPPPLPEAQAQSPLSQATVHQGSPHPYRPSSSSSADRSIPKKRSFTGTAIPPYVPHINTRDLGLRQSISHSSLSSAPTSAVDVEMDGLPAGVGAADDDADGEGEADDMLKPLESGGQGAGGAGVSSVVKGVGTTNNFVTKLYGMINDPKSAHFIAWTDLGTSFVVSNVGEFSRSILGSHFKHNNFSSFVRQLNMYGFHKINRTPRAQRSSTDQQTWEFSHHKFLRGRPDLLEEIRRKALEPDPSIKARVELPGELAAQLTAVREENRRVWDALALERRRVERLVGVVGRLWDVVGKGFPGSVPAFPADLLESDTGDSPNIYVTSPTSSNARYGGAPPSLSTSMSSQSLTQLSSSPGSSPTAPDFAGVHTLSRQSSFSFSYPHPLPVTGEHEAKRPRTSASHELLNDAGGGGSAPKKTARARSDSAPLGPGYPQPYAGWGGRERSGSGVFAPAPAPGMRVPAAPMLGLGMEDAGGTSSPVR